MPEFENHPLARGQLGEDTASLLGALLITTVALAAFSRAEVTPVERRPFFVYLDEFQSFTTRSLATMTAELRKYGIGVIASLISSIVVTHNLLAIVLASTNFRRPALLGVDRARPS